MNTYEKVVHYIIDKVKDDPSKLGSTKLNKILWFSDLLYYLESGKSITGEKYKKLQHGPVPSSILSVIRKIESDGVIARRQDSFHGYPQIQYLSLKDADISGFTGAQKNIIDEMIDVICNNHTANSISELTHNEMWNMAADNEEIPLYSVFTITPGEITSSDVEWARTRTCQ